MILTKEMENILSKEDLEKVREYNIFNDIVLKEVDGKYQISTDIEFLKLLNGFDFSYVFSDSGLVYASGRAYQEKLYEVAVTNPEWMKLYDQTMSFTQPDYVPVSYPSVPDNVLRLKRALNQGWKSAEDYAHFNKLTETFYKDIVNYVLTYKTNASVYSPIGSNVKELDNNEKFLAIPIKVEERITELVPKILEAFYGSKDPEEMKTKSGWIENGYRGVATCVVYRGITFFINH